jgi:hypothetical protein
MPGDPTGISAQADVRRFRAIARRGGEGEHARGDHVVHVTITLDGLVRLDQQPAVRVIALTPFVVARVTLEVDQVAHALEGQVQSALAKLHDNLTRVIVVAGGRAEAVVDR